MNDQELKSILQETHPVLPGQEARAWTLLQERLGGGPASLPWLSWRPFAALGAGIAALVLITFQAAAPTEVAVSASSQSPGIFASAFYSQPAHAQVVWLNGMEPAKDGPTYMDRTGKIGDDSPSSSPDSL